MYLLFMKVAEETLLRLLSDGRPGAGIHDIQKLAVVANYYSINDIQIYTQLTKRPRTL